MVTETQILVVAAVPYVFRMSRVAKMLGEDDG